MIKFLPIVILALLIAGFVYFELVGLDAFVLINVVIAIVIVLVKLSQATVRRRRAEQQKKHKD